MTDTLTRELLLPLMQGWLEMGKNIRAGYKYSEDEKMLVVVNVFAQGEIRVIGTAWKTDEEKRLVMKEISDGCRDIKAQAVAVISDTRWTTAKALCSYFGREEPDVRNEVEFAQFKKWYSTLLAKHGGELKKLPREVWYEAVMVACKGPEIETTMLSATYHEGPNDTVVFTPSGVKGMDDPGEGSILGLIPDWWTQ